MPPDNGLSLAARGVRRAYGGRAVLRGVNLELSPGELLLVAGPNGAGKSTLLRLLAGLSRPDSGEIRVMGRIVRGSDAAARRPIGYLAHRSALYEDLTLSENLAFTAQLYQLERPAEAARQALSAWGLAEQAEQLPRQLSRGMVQRAALARALLHRPSLLLLDEPFTGLDASSAAQFRDFLRAQVSAGATIIVVTHHLGEAWELATRVALLADGAWAREPSLPAPLSEFLQQVRGVLDA